MATSMSRTEYNRMYMRDYRKKNPEIVKKGKRKVLSNYLEKRHQVLEHYGHKCVCCGEKEKEFLTIDHANGDGKKQRKEVPAQRNNFYYWIIKNGFPEDLQLLCRNCHTAKHKYGGCPHDKSRS